jgi:hypothetical protein
MINQNISKPKIILPTEKIKGTRVNPKILLIYAIQKLGKTSILSKLENCLIIDTEDGTESANIEALKIKCSNLSELNEIGKAIIAAQKPYKFIAIDTVTEFESWCEKEATERYKKSTLGSNFTGNSVLELPRGGGYLYLRLAFQRYLEYVTTLADNIILVAHVKDSEMVVKAGKDEKGNDEYKELGKDSVSSFSIDLMGKDKQIACAKADAIAFMYKKVIGSEKGKPITPRFLNFNSDEVLTGSRISRLRGEILISQMEKDGKQTFDDNEEGEIKTFWEKIYI